MTTQRGRRSSSRGSSRRGNRPNYLWHADATALTSVAPGAAARFDLLESMRGASAERHQRRGMTAVRLIYDLSFITTLAGTESFGSFMVTPLSVDADVAGVHPDPEQGEQDAAWVWAPFHERQVNRDTVHIRGDLRTARRILGIDYTLEFVLDVAASAATGIDLIFAFRILMKLP